jgi:DNA replication protein DnaC
MEQIAEIAKRIMPGRQWSQPPQPRPKGVQRVTLDDLDLNSQGIKTAVETARRWAERKPTNQDASIVFSGPVGTGKTHIAKAILWSIYNHLEDGTPVAPVGRFYVANDLIQALEPDTRVATLIPFDCPIFVIDDVGSEQNIAYVSNDFQAREIQNRYFKIIDYCYTWQVSTIITTNLKIMELADRIGGRCFSRLQQMAPAGFMVDMAGVPDYRRVSSGR